MGINYVGTLAVDDKDVHHTGIHRFRADKLFIVDPTDATKILKLSAASIAASTTITKDGNLAGQIYYFNQHAKIGATSGWAVNAADDLGVLATCPASQTNSTLIIPLGFLKIGWTVTAFALIGQIESAGGAVTLDADLRKLTAADADITDASLETMTQISVTADDTIESTNSSTTLSTPEVIAVGETLYLLLDAVTAASTDIAIQGATLTITET